jgi:lipopolysaccharide biosynthesis glycosyltransferase
MLKIFIGYDPRQAISLHVLTHSLIEHTSVPLQIIPLKLETLPFKRQGLTPFTYSRFLVPWLCEFQGAALFLDADILCTTDIRALVEEVNGKECAVAACNTKPEYERAAVMFFNCEHPDNLKLTPDYLETTGDKLHLISWTQAIHWLPNRFNFLVGYDDPAWCQGKTPALVHYTKGVPAWPETKDCDFAHLWQQARAGAFIPAVTWDTLMGRSNHATEGPGGVTIPAPRVPDAVHEPQRS